MGFNFFRKAKGNLDAARNNEGQEAKMTAVEAQLVTSAMNEEVQFDNDLNALQGTLEPEIKLIQQISQAYAKKKTYVVGIQALRAAESAVRSGMGRATNQIKVLNQHIYRVVEKGRYGAARGIVPGSQGQALQQEAQRLERERLNMIKRLSADLQIALKEDQLRRSKLQPAVGVNNQLLGVIRAYESLLNKQNKELTQAINALGQKINAEIKALQESKPMTAVTDEELRAAGINV